MRNSTGVSNTCPDIDTIKQLVRDILLDVKPGKIISKFEYKVMEEASEEILDMCEDLRSANADLRDCAIERGEKLDEERDQNHYLSQTIEDLEYKLNDLQVAV